MAQKPTVIKDTYQVLVMNGSVISSKAVRRLTAYSAESRQDWEHHTEIGNKTIVNTSYDTPQTVVTLDMDISDQTLRTLHNLCFLSSGAVDQDDFEGAYAYLMVICSEDGTSIDRCHIYPGCALNSMRMNTALNTSATLSLSFEGMEEHVLLNAKRVAAMEVLSTPVYGSSNTTWNATTLDGGTYTELYLYVDEEKFTVTATTESGKFKWDDSTDVVTLYGKDRSAASRAVLIAYLTTPTGGDTFSNITAATTAIMGVNHHKTEIFIGDGTVPSSKTLRLQSLATDIPLTREVHEEIGNVDPYDRSLDYPLEITHTVETKQSDLELYAALAGQTFSSVTDLYPTLFESNQDSVMRVKYFSSKARTTEILRFDYTGLRTLGPAMTLNTGGVAGETWTLLGDDVTISGILYT